ncbi:M23 family metallopeptidase [Novosphingobium sp. ZN18A2]|uniref:M23 family metallopeptidase n=1 Tax=Novosphingobium sp. ZN18A2 TaxID=3079861 RepID=UPI0030D3A63D
MFTPREQLAGFPVDDGPFAVQDSGLTFRQRIKAMPSAAPEDPAEPESNPRPAWFDRIAARIPGFDAARSRSGEFDWAPDLAENIGSARWFRGLATFAGLTMVALAMWPDFSPVEAAPMVRMDLPASREMRSVGVQPLALGGLSGRHWDANAMAVPLASAPERPSVNLVATLGAGDSFDKMLQRAGVGGFDAGRISALVEKTVPVSSLRPGTRFSITLGSRADPATPRPLEALSFRARFDLDLSLTRQGEGFALARKTIPVDATPLRIRGIVGSSLFRSARAAGAPASAVQEYLQTLDQHGQLDEMAPSDEFDMVIGYKRAAGGAVQVGDLLYAGLERDGKPRTELVRFGAAGNFYDALDDGNGAGTAQSYSLGMPVANGHETSPFGMRRHPILGYVRMHDGIDYGAPMGSPIYAVADGVVSFAGRRGGYGNFVKLDNGGGIATGYGHMSRIAVSGGQPVRRGQVIGYVGSTGLSTGPHLHFEVRRNGRPIDPASVNFVVSQPAVPDAKLPEIRSRLKELLAVQPGAALTAVN